MRVPVLVILLTLGTAACPATVKTSVESDLHAVVREEVRALEREKERTREEIKETVQEGPVTVVETGAWDELVFSDEPGAPRAVAVPGTLSWLSPSSTPARSERAPRVIHHPARRETVVGPRQTVVEVDRKTTQDRATEGEKKATQDTRLEVKKAEEKPQRLIPWWVWLLGLGLLVASVLYLKRRVGL